MHDHNTTLTGCERCELHQQRAPCPMPASAASRGGTSRLFFFTEYGIPNTAAAQLPTGER